MQSIAYKIIDLWWKPWHFLKRFTPKSLFGRSLLILVLPIIIIQVILSYVFFDRHLEMVISQQADDIAGDIRFIIDTSTIPIFTPKKIQQIETHLKLTVSWQESKKLETIGRRKAGWLYDYMGNALDKSLNLPFYLTLDRHSIHVLVQLPDGVVKFSTPRKRLFNRTMPLVLIWTTISALLLFIVASLFMRNQIKPLWRLAEATDRFGKGQDTGNIRLEGATEVRQAARAFNLMRDRIQRYIHERTELLAGVSHDLRTPLTRMRLQLTMMPDSPEVKGLTEDVTSMQNMVAGFLDFAKENEDETVQSCNVPTLCQEIIKSLSHQKLKIHLSAPEQLFWKIKIGFIKRCLTNLLLNSTRYAQQAWLTLTVKQHWLEICIDDDGPGIPEAERENVFRPFYRLDPARRQETGETGLGLSIARDAIRRHGGQIRLYQAPQGGLRVTIRIPR